MGVILKKIADEDFVIEQVEVDVNDSSKETVVIEKQLTTAGVRKSIKARLTALRNIVDALNVRKAEVQAEIALLKAELDKYQISED